MKLCQGLQARHSIIKALAHQSDATLCDATKLRICTYEQRRDAMLYLNIRFHTHESCKVWWMDMLVDEWDYRRVDGCVDRWMDWWANG